MQTMKYIPLFLLISVSTVKGLNNPITLNSALPANDQTEQLAEMRLLTKALWGPNGVVRKAGLAPETKKGELELRHKMLKWHQNLGLVTMASLMTQTVIGKQLYDNEVDDYTRTAKLHKRLGYTTWGLYMTTASLSLAAPPPRKQYSTRSSIKWHRYLSYIHFSAMLIQPYLGYMAVNNPEHYDYYIKYHDTVGTIGALSFSLAFFTVFLP